MNKCERLITEFMQLMMCGSVGIKFVYHSDSYYKCLL